ncbi:Protein CBG06833 [Caenorhabditis briggsae]|uniref:Protein CBG06833 n=1 Tax=Caenorhabditis briggsae TaxID=6238 RepID=A8X364_CAEBR|nr:Protein CBG06833 [Caenorhabditis briggsae]CAP27074.2 Protein CBG06833 [Caenorhabditis briggsae]
MEGAIYKCRICQKCYCSTYSLKKHLKEKHENQPINPGQCPPAKCFLCKEKFWTLPALFKHINTQHEGKVQHAGIFTRMSVTGTVPPEQDANKENNVISESLASSSSSGTLPSDSPANTLPAFPNRNRTPFMINDILN